MVDLIWLGSFIILHNAGVIVIKIRGQNTASSTLKEVLYLVSFLLLWLLPAAYRSFANHYVPRMPVCLRYFQNISCLFTQAVNYWRLDYVQVRLQPASDWITLPQDSFFQMQPFGYRTRLNFFMDISLGRAGYSRRAELAQWIRRRYKILHPDQPGLVAVRFVAGMYQVGRNLPQGRWRDPPLEAYSPETHSILSTHYFQDQAKVAR